MELNDQGYIKGVAIMQIFQPRHIGLAQQLLEAIREREVERSLEKGKQLFEEIFGKRFASEIEQNGILRYRSLGGPEDNIQYFGVLYENASPSGVYENFSLVVFPDYTGGTSQLLLCYGIGTGGITDDAEWLEIPWVKRILKLLLRFINQEQWNAKETVVFVKNDLLDEYSEVPGTVKSKLGNFSDYKELWKKYGKFLPTVCVIETTVEGAQAFLAHLLLYALFRRWTLRKEFATILENILLPKLLDIWREYPRIEKLSNYLLQRRYIILQGPPGTGKTHFAEQLASNLIRQEKIAGYEIIQFHSSVSYEDFIEGIKPDTDSDRLVFREHKGPFLKILQKAEQDERGYVLIIDEINRGNLAKILGEAIFLLEPTEERTVQLRSGRKISMPMNLYIIGTMNTADRTIAILDFAVRRRFAFIDIWPSAQKLEEILNQKAVEAKVRSQALEYYNRIQNIFFRYASDEELHLQPGHTYFIVNSEDELKHRLQYEVVPLLREYLSEGRLSMATNEILSLIDEVLYR